MKQVFGASVLLILTISFKVNITVVVVTWTTYTTCMTTLCRSVGKELVFRELEAPERITTSKSMTGWQQNPQFLKYSTSATNCLFHCHAVILDAQALRIRLAGVSEEREPRGKITDHGGKSVPGHHSLKKCRDSERVNGSV